MKVLEAWSWNPAADEFVPDLIVFDDTDEEARYTGMPHLVVEILSGGPALRTSCARHTSMPLSESLAAGWSTLTGRR